MATVNSSIVLISLPAIFRGIKLNPLTTSNVSYLLWMLMGYMVVMAVLVVSIGRIGDMFGRVRIYNLGFTVFTVGSIGLSLVFFTGPQAALTLIGLRLIQGVGGAMLMANATAIVTDAFPAEQRGMALSFNVVAAIAGSFIGLVVGGVLSTIDWHLVFLVSVPVGVIGTVWAFFMLREIGRVKRARIDWLGNITFAIGLIAVLVGITYGIQPYGGHDMGWSNPMVVGELGGGVALLVLFVIVELIVKEPMFRLGLFKRAAFSFGNIATLLAATGRGGLMFMVIIWLQGIWLPLHGYSFAQTPLWAAIYMLPMTGGFLVAGPLSGILSDHFGARPFATGGMIGAAATFGLMLLLPANFNYLYFGLLLFSIGLFMGMFSSPNSAGIMNSVPPGQRGVASGMLATFQNAGMNLSIGLFFSLIVAGLSTTLPGALFGGLTKAGVPTLVATKIAHLPPVATLFAAFLGYNPMQQLLGPALKALPAGAAAHLTSRAYFPQLISSPFMSGMHLTFAFAAVMMLIAAVASWLRGGKYVYREEMETAGEAGGGAVAPMVVPAALPPVPGVTQPVQVSPPVVTLSAAAGLGGHGVAQQVAARLGVRLLDLGGGRNHLTETLEGVLNDDGRSAAALARILAGMTTAMTGSDQQRFQDRLREEVVDLASRPGVVVYGDGGAHLLRHNPGALHVRLDAPEESRVYVVMTREGVDALTAQRRLREEEREAERTSAGWREEGGESIGYQLVLDPTVLPSETCAEVIVAAARTRLARPEQPLLRDRPVTAAPRPQPVAAPPILQRRDDEPEPELTAAAPQAAPGNGHGNGSGFTNGHTEPTAESAESVEAAPADELLDRLARALRAELAKREDTTP
ncbi:MAG TPA: MFS transporter [Candidatus Dormibacteraeota bacterium]|nr:MFS transporter [Candidatus Dormibacteraeota bacterium]